MSIQTQKIELTELFEAPIGPIDEDGIRWLSPLAPPFRVAGFPWLGEEGVYRRLPLRPRVELPPAVHRLANCTAGGQVRFRTDASRLLIKVRLSGGASMYHMPATGQCGFDCYIGEPGRQQYVSTAQFQAKQKEYISQLYRWPGKREYTVTLNFPLYQGVEELWIGVDQHAAVSEPPSYKSDKSIIVYGTSVTQGGCASRPGMAYTNLLSRMIPMEFVNLGFSGSGKGEPELAELAADIANPALYILDYEGNTGPVENIAKSLPVFLRILRERHPLVPILVVSRVRNGGDALHEGRAELHERRRQVQRENVELRRAEGDRHLHFLDGHTLIGLEDANECTVDGTHPTDLGFMLMARSLAPVVRSLVEEWISYEKE